MHKNNEEEEIVTCSCPTFRVRDKCIHFDLATSRLSKLIQEKPIQADLVERAILAYIDIDQANKLIYFVPNTSSSKWVQLRLKGADLTSWNCQSHKFGKNQNQGLCPHKDLLRNQEGKFIESLFARHDLEVESRRERTEPDDLRLMNELLRDEAENGATSDADDPVGVSAFRYVIVPLLV